MKPTRIILLMWLSWAIIVLGFQAWATARIDPKYPDRAQDWTTRFTEEGYQQGRVFLLDPFMNNQVAWDSEYYLAIAIGSLPWITMMSSPSTGVNPSWSPASPRCARGAMSALISAVVKCSSSDGT